MSTRALTREVSLSSLLNNMKVKTRGFTLIETIVYMALYAIIMGGALVSVYSIFQSSSHTTARVLVHEEGNFMVGKINWAMEGISSITSPLVNATGQVLLVTKSDASLGVVGVSIVGSNMMIQIGGVNEVLNNSNVRINATPFITHTRASTDGISPESIAVRFTVTTLTEDGLTYTQDFSTVKYLRK